MTACSSSPSRAIFVMIRSSPYAMGSDYSDLLPGVVHNWVVDQFAHRLQARSQAQITWKEAITETPLCESGHKMPSKSAAYFYG
ncbi:hypothetical protein MCNF_20880 [Mycolicibacterium confluentis]|uniref:Uncharacterized protein n=1 Tax=Mycolicibacterium confluentis TaxID=28047 RepID=A0A7I7XWU0_9MYCO|nr:hypothetical protein MCNF_20880 [Mycolicibacterium confluentis]